MIEGLNEYEVYELIKDIYNSVKKELNEKYFEKVCNDALKKFEEYKIPNYDSKREIVGTAVYVFDVIEGPKAIYNELELDASGLFECIVKESKQKILTKDHIMHIIPISAKLPKHFLVATYKGCELDERAYECVKEQFEKKAFEDIKNDLKDMLILKEQRKGTINDFIITEFDERAGPNIIYSKKEYSNEFKDDLLAMTDCSEKLNAILEKDGIYYHFMPINIDSGFHRGKNMYGVIVASNHFELNKQMTEDMKNYFEEKIIDYNNEIKKSTDQLSKEDMFIDTKKKALEIANKLYDVLVGAPND